MWWSEWGRRVVKISKIHLEVFLRGPNKAVIDNIRKKRLGHVGIDLISFVSKLVPGFGKPLFAVLLGQKILNKGHIEPYFHLVL